VKLRHKSTVGCGLTAKLQIINFARIAQNYAVPLRTVLVGDAAYCPSLLAGEGAAFAMAGAYILAGELQRSNGGPCASL